MASTTISSSSPLVVINDTDHSGYAWIATILCMVFTTLFSTMYFFIQWRDLAVDSYVSMGSAAVALAQYILAFIALAHGAGKSRSAPIAHGTPDLGILLLASEAVLIVALIGTKCVIPLFLRKVLSKSTSRLKAWCWVVAGLCLVWGITSLLVVVVSCHWIPLTLGDISQQCHGQSARWISVAVLDAVIEGMNVVLSVCIIFPLQMRLSLKLFYIAPFTFRLVCPVLLGLHAYYIDQYLQSDKPGVNIIAAFCIQELVLCYSFVSAIVPTMTKFLRDFSTSMGMQYSESRVDEHGSSKNAGYRLDRVATRPSVAPTTPPAILRPEDTRYAAHCQHLRQLRAGSIGSDISSQPIIRKNIDYDVAYEPDRPQVPT